jgi:tyrosyl-tRNA synthetase
MILQSVDFLTLHQQYHCNMQIGGSDQWGNLTAGLDLIRRIEGQEAKVGCMTAHLITKSDGKKFGKSEDGALFLDRKLTSPYKLYQYFINTSDEDAIRYLRVFTFLSKDEIEKIAVEHDRNPSLRLAQKTLAYEVVKTIHSKNDAERVIKMSEALFSGEVTSLSEEEITELFASSIVKLKGVFTLEDLLIEVKAAKSKREAREFIQGNSILINGKKHTDPSEIVTPTDALFGRYTLLRRGKKNYYLIEHIN